MAKHLRPRTPRYRQSVRWHYAQLQQYWLASDVQGFLARSQVHEIHVRHHLLFGQRGLFAEPGEQVGTICWQRSPFAFGRAGVPMEQPALCSICESFVHQRNRKCSCHLLVCRIQTCFFLFRSMFLNLARYNGTGLERFIGKFRGGVYAYPRVERFCCRQ